MVKKISALFLDIGGVLLTNGWDHHSRNKAIEQFHLDAQEVNARHALMFDTYEIGHLSLDVYLEKVIFYEARAFTMDVFKQFMFSQSQPYIDMIDFVRQLKERFRWKHVAVSNEGRELVEYRLKAFHMTNYIDFFIFSSFVGLRKPDKRIFQLALDCAQVPPEEVIYIDDRLLLVEIAESFGMNGIHHKDLASTKHVIEQMLK
jgi:putative hydrolase of the HAD superfamily